MTGTDLREAFEHAHQRILGAHGLVSGLADVAGEVVSVDDALREVADMLDRIAAEMHEALHPALAAGIRPA